MYQQFGNSISKKERIWTFIGPSFSLGALVPSVPIPFHIPRTANYVDITCIEAGSSGGGGGAAAAATAAAGGGGGASGGVTRGLFKACLLPSTIWIQPASATLGGSGQVQGGAAANNGNGGGASIVTVAPSATLAVNYILASPAPSASQGGAASANTAGTGGGAPNALSATNMIVSSLGTWTSLGGQAGATGGTGTAPSAGGNIQWGATPFNAFCCAGAGGGSVNAGTTVAAGGSITSLITQSVVSNSLTFAPSSTAGSPGLDGVSWGQAYWLPYTSTGGTGGTGNSSAGVGGAGGGGGIGSGGGGGGASNGTNSVGGAGGLGGPGAVIIVIW